MNIYTDSVYDGMLEEFRKLAAELPPPPSVEEIQRQMAQNKLKWDQFETEFKARNPTAQIPGPNTPGVNLRDLKTGLPQMATGFKNMGHDIVRQAAPELIKGFVGRGIERFGAPILGGGMMLAGLLGLGITGGRASQKQPAQNPMQQPIAQQKPKGFSMSSSLA